MEVKAKKCKGSGKAIGHGCGTETKFRKYGLCTADCYPDWLLNTEQGREVLEKGTLRGSKKVKTEKAREQRTRDKEKLEAMKGLSDWMNDLQKVFNQYIRLRDHNLPCISCGTIANIKYDAGHYLSVGSYPNLRVDEMNVNKQCSKFCNVEKRGNIVEYRDGLIKKYGLDEVRDLESKRQSVWKPAIFEVREMIVHYKAKVKEMKNDL